MARILSSVACNLDSSLLAACYPLLQEDRVEAMEWSFDTLYQIKEIPEWFEALLQAYSHEKRLIGHGVFFSLFSGKWSKHQEEWLLQLKGVCKRYSFDHITEHFGFMTGKDFHNGAPLNIPYTKNTLAIGRDRLSRIFDACRCPVGLENLAFSYSLDEVKRHGEFLEKLIEPLNGFIILDLHNLYCQLQNFSIAQEGLLALYPLDKVREIHISGGSWEDSQMEEGKRIRRDTHNDMVPSDVFRLLETILPRCANLKFVVLEQLGNSLDTTESRMHFYDDFLRMEHIVQLHNRSFPEGKCLNDFLPLNLLLPEKIEEDEFLYLQQLELSDILENSPSCEAAIEALHRSSLAQSEWNIESWQPYMIETAVNIAKKWKK